MHYLKVTWGMCAASALAAISALCGVTALYLPRPHVVALVAALCGFTGAGLGLWLGLQSYRKQRWERARRVLIAAHEGRLLGARAQAPLPPDAFAQERNTCQSKIS